MRKNFIEFVKAVRSLNENFKVGKKFDWQVMAYVYIGIREETKDGVIFKEVYENPFRVDLRKPEFEQPVVVKYVRREDEVEQWVEDGFNLKKWLEEKKQVKLGENGQEVILG